jgi:hypothetical protein
MKTDYFPTFSDKPRYVRMVKHVKAADGGLQFTPLSVEQRRFIGVCEAGMDAYGAPDGHLCTHDTPRGWTPSAPFLARTSGRDRRRDNALCLHDIRTRNNL